MKKLVFYIIVTTFIGILPSLLQYGAFMPYGDFANQQIPFIMETKRMFASGAPWWSWNTYFGDNFIGAYSFYTITSPFVWINCLFPYEYIIESITFTLFLKLICMGVFTFLYLKKMDLDETLSQVGALMYVFSSFTISNLYYYHFLEPMMCFPLFLIAIEKYMREEKYSDVILALATFLIAFINFYFFPCSLIPGIIYYFCRTTSKDYHFSGKRFGYAVVLVILGTCMSAFILWPTITYMIGGPRVEANTYVSITNILERIRTLFTPKIVDGSNKLIIGTSWNSNATYLPVIGCFLAFMYCWKQRDWIARVSIIAIIFYITPLNGIFSAFTNPNYSRWAYTLVLFLVLASMKYLALDIKIRMNQAITYSFICLLYVMGIYVVGWRLQASTYFNIEKGYFVFNSIILGLFLFSLFLLLTFVKWGNKKSLINYIALFSTVYFSIFMVKRTDISIKYLKTNIDILYNQGVCEQYIKKNKLERMPNNHPFKYRTYFITRNQYCFNNISLLKNFPSIETYNSNQNNNIRKLFNTSDPTIIKKRNQFSPTYNIPSFLSLMSVRDINIFNDQKRKPLQLGKMNLEEKGDGYNIYSNPNYIPLGYTYDHYIDEALIDSLLQVLPRKDIPLQLLANLSVRKEDIPVISKYLRKGNINESYDLDSVVVERRKNVCKSFKGDTHGFSANINMNRPNLVFFSVPADKGFTASVDGNVEKIYKVNLGQIGIVVPKGIHTIRCEFFPLGLNEGGICSIVALIIILTLTVRDIREYNFK